MRLVLWGTPRKQYLVDYNKLVPSGKRFTIPIEQFMFKLVARMASQ